MTIHTKDSSKKFKGLFSAFLSPTLLGFIPIIAKIAYSYNVDVFTVAAIRTLIAAGALWAIVLLFDRSSIVSSKPAIIGSFIAGAINGLAGR